MTKDPREFCEIDEPNENEIEAMKEVARQKLASFKASERELAAERAATDALLRAVFDYVLNYDNHGKAVRDLYFAANAHPRAGAVKKGMEKS